MNDQRPSPTAHPLPKPGLAYIRYIPDWSQARLRQLLNVARQNLTDGDRIPALWLHTPGDGRNIYVIDGRDLQLVVDVDESARLLDAIDDSGVLDDSPSSTQP